MNSVLKLEGNQQLLTAKTTQLQADFDTDCQNLVAELTTRAAKLHNYRLIFEQYVEIGGQPAAPNSNNYTTTGGF